MLDISIDEIDFNEIASVSFGNNFVKPLILFNQLYKKIPNVYKIHLNDADLFCKLFEKKYSDSFKEKKSFKTFTSKKFEGDIDLYIMKDETIIHLSNFILIYTTSEINWQDIITKEFKNCLYKTKKENKIWLLTQTQNGLDTMSFKLDKRKLDIDKCYNDDFKDVYNKVINNIDNKNLKGVHLFYGTPGTGKSTFIKHLITKTKKKVIFISPQIGASLNQPEFTEFLFENKNCILVIEEAERLIESREFGNSAISSLLNITDGLLSDDLKIQVICTFNTDLKNIDKALMRKGRLQSIYEFKKLCKEKTNKLVRELYNIEVNKEMTLADIFNIENENFNKIEIKQSKIGF